jgi:hypothetical protein
MREECARVGRKPAEIEVTAGRGLVDADGAKQLQDLGVSRAIIPPPAFDEDGVRKGLHEFADRVITKLR